MAEVSNAPIPQPNAIELLDEEIQQVRQQIRTLASRRNALSAFLLTSSKISPPSNITLPPLQLKTLNSRIAKAKRDHHTSTHRLSLSATRFSIRDPDPNAIDDRRVTGIRIEEYNPATRTFDTPAYVFLNRPWAKPSTEPSTENVEQEDASSQNNEDAARYRIHRHTLPPSVNVDALAHTYLPGPSHDSEKPARKQDLQGFVRTLRRELVSLRKRQDAVEKANRERQKNGNRKLGAVNAEATDLRVIWPDGSLARLRVDKRGDIGECRVEAENGERRRDLERRIKAAEGIGGLDGVLNAAAEEGEGEGA